MTVPDFNSLSSAELATYDPKNNYRNAVRCLKEIDRRISGALSDPEVIDLSKAYESLVGKLSTQHAEWYENKEMRTILEHITICFASRVQQTGPTVVSPKDSTYEVKVASPRKVPLKQSSPPGKPRELETQEYHANLEGLQRIFAQRSKQVSQQVIKQIAAHLTNEAKTLFQETRIDYSKMPYKEKASIETAFSKGGDEAAAEVLSSFLTGTKQVEAPKAPAQSSAVVTLKHQERAKPIELGNLSPALSEIPQAVILEERQKATEATKAGDSIKPLLDFKFSEVTNHLLNQELDGFKARASVIKQKIDTLSKSERDAFEKNLKDNVMESLYAMSDTCSGASAKTDRGMAARLNYVTCFDALNNPSWREKFHIPSRQGGSFNPLYGGPETRFLEFNKMLNVGIGGVGKLEPIREGEVRGDEDAASIRGMVKKNIPHNVDGAVAAVPGGKICLQNVKHISEYLTDALKKMKNNEAAPNPIEILGKSYQAEITNHTCSNGNGRAAVLNLMANAQDFGLPMPLLSKPATRMIHAMHEQMAYKDNMSPLDAAMGVAQGIDSMLRLQEELLGIASS